MTKQLAGKAYGFMNCRKSRGDVEWIAQDLKGFMYEDLKSQLGHNAPRLDLMRLKVNQGLTCLKQRGKLIEARTELLKTVIRAEKEGRIFSKPAVAIMGALRMNGTDYALVYTFGNLYMIGASMPGASNLQVADELSAIMNNMYSTGYLFEDGEPFRGMITYLENGGYILRG